jgi:hypothetical protein
MPTHTVNIIYCGLEKDRNNQPIRHVAAQLRRCEQLAAETFGGYSHSVMDGGWIDQCVPHADVVVREKSLRWEIVTDADEEAEVDKFAEFVRVLFHQNTVIVSSYEVRSRNISSRETGTQQQAA